MNNVWRKIIGNKLDSSGNKVNTHSEITNNELGTKKNSSFIKPVFFVTSDDEEYLKKFDFQYDPLDTSSKVEKSLEDTLNKKSSSSYKYFSEYLEICEVDRLLLFVEMCEKFQELLNPPHLYTTSKLNNDNFNEDQNMRDTISKTKMILPDLVSNIPQDVVVTPPQASPDYNTVPLEPHSNDYTIKSSSLESTTEIDPILSLAFEIFLKYISCDAEQYIAIKSEIRNSIEETISRGTVSMNLFSEAVQEVFSTLESYYQKYLVSECFLRHEIEVLTSQNVTIQDVLSSESAMPYFMEYMEQEGCKLLLEFWIFVSNFRNHLHAKTDNGNSEQSQLDAMILYDKYFSLQAESPLGFSDHIRFMVESNICQEEGPLYTCFDVPLRIVFFILQRDHLRGYLSSSLHMRLLRELLKKVKSSSKQRSGSMSTGSSDTSVSVSNTPRVNISQTNTLLAMDSSQSGCKVLKNINDASLSMRIDANQILDPDSLWRRKNFTKLSCGYVDELGRFESDIQPEPGRKEESKISRTFKKIVKKEEKKMKEDLAYKVAEMIIKDVTTVTLGEDYESTLNSPISPTGSNDQFTLPSSERATLTKRLPARSQSDFNLSSS